MGASSNQARAYERAPLRERATLVINGANYPVIVSRVGGGGVFVETTLPLEKGTQVLVRFRLACFDEPLVVKGEIRWISSGAGRSPAGLGIAFLDLAPAKSQQIVEFVAERGNILWTVDSLLRDGTTDLARLRKLLEKVDMASVNSVDELKAAVRDGLEGFFGPRSSSSN